MIRTFTPTLVAAACAALLAAPRAVASDPATTPNVVLLQKGDAVPGYPAGSADFSPLVARYGGDGWLLGPTMTGFVELLVGEQGLGVFEGQALTGGDVVGETWISVDGDAAGRIAQLVFLDEPGATDAVVIHDQVVLRQGDPLDAEGVELFSTWSQLDSVTLDESDHLFVRGEVVPPIFPIAREVLVRYDVDPQGALSNPLVLLHETDEYADGRTIRQIGKLGDANWSVADDGRVLSVLRLSTPGDVDHDVIALNGVILAEDDTALAPGVRWHVTISDRVELNARGDWALRSRVDSGEGGIGHVILVRNGVTLAEVGGPVPGIPGSEIEHLTGPRLADDGSTMFWAEWTEGPVSRSGFWVDDRLVVEVGATLIGGLPLNSVHELDGRWDIADDGGRLLFIGSDQFTASWYVFEVALKPWVSLGGGLAGHAGAAPQLTASGTLEPETPVQLALDAALPGGVTHAVLGFTQLDAPFKGGTLCPAPDLIVFGVPVDANGAAQLATTWPAGVPAGSAFWLQFWTPDPSGPSGFSASNCVSAVTP